MFLCLSGPQELCLYARHLEGIGYLIGKRGELRLPPVYHVEDNSALQQQRPCFALFWAVEQ